ncbi:flagellin [Kineococcus sp. DHX-1]|uniref:flagellin N-terminal helical domain-containing protein n=1 Tax=Kineococcus sp. DHX-1 TaxID=3349638 RepID=UPI0036D2EFF2
MGLRINSNIAALSSYNNLNKTDKAVSGSLEKLSSGFRINKAADDAAGLVVSEGLKSQIGGLTVAVRNAQDGVNVAQTADGALGTVTDILQRMRDLAVQASNSGSQDTTAQAAANSEFSQLSKELDRISATTSFGNQSLLSGSYNGQFQIGAFNTANDRVAVDLTANVFGTAVPAASATALKSTGSVVANTRLDYTAGGGGTGTPGAATSFTVSVDGGAATTVNLTGVYADANAKLTAINTALSSAGVTASYDASGHLAFTTTATGTGHSITIGGTGATAEFGTATTSGGAAATYGTATGFTAAGLGLGSTSVATTAGAQTAIADVDNALKNVSAARATVGAIQNRFEKTIDNLNTAIQNITASNSAIRDTDMAAEMTKFTKNQVLAQAGTSMLAQANSSTQNILTLLRG